MDEKFCYKNSLLNEKIHLIIKKREEVLADYYRDNPTKVPSRNKADEEASLEHTHDDGVTHSHADGDKPHTHEETKKDEWVEDADGNFVKKDSE